MASLITKCLPVIEKETILQLNIEFDKVRIGVDNGFQPRVTHNSLDATQRQHSLFELVIVERLGHGVEAVLVRLDWVRS